MQTTPIADCLVIGAGPAGLTAALYLRRYLRSVVVADHGQSRALSIERTWNFPAFVDGIAGSDLLRRLREQLAGVQGVVRTGEVTGLRVRPDGGFSADSSGQTWQARTVLLATGVVDGVPTLPGTEAVQQRGLLRQCPVCDGYEHRGQRILVLGDGPHAASEAGFLAHYSAQVALVGLNAQPGATSPGVHRLHVKAAWLEALNGGGLRLGLLDGSTQDFDVAYAALKVEPRSQLGRRLGAKVDDCGSLVADAHGATSVDGLYAAGDVVSGLDQLIVSASQGAVAATAIHNRLRGATD